MSGVSMFRAAIHKHWRRIRFQQIYRRFRSYTMIPPAAFISNLILAERARHVPGCVVECGVWRGGMSAGLAVILGPDRRYYLFDSFEGLPPAKQIDGPAALKWQQSIEAPEYRDNCSAPPEYAKEAMSLAGANHVELIKGWFAETVPNHFFDEPIALLRLDADWYDSTIVCLEGLFDRLSPGGIVIIDDYYTWTGCSRAVHDFLSHRSATERIDAFGGVCYLVKQAAENAGTNEPGRLEIVTAMPSALTGPQGPIRCSG